MKKTLSHIIYEYKDKKFKWGKVDCCTFTFSVIGDFTGKKFPEWKVVTYNNKKGAMDALKKLNCKKLKDLPGIILNTEKKEGSAAKLGEPVYYVNEDGTGILGVCNGKRAYFLQHGKGLTARKIEECEYSWSID